MAARGQDPRAGELAPFIRREALRQPSFGNVEPAVREVVLDKPQGAGMVADPGLLGYSVQSEGGSGGDGEAGIGDAQHRGMVCGIQSASDRLRVVASHGPFLLSRTELAISRLSVVGRAVSDRRALHVDDLARVFDPEFPDSRGMYEMGYRTILAIPLLREGEPIVLAICS